MIVDDFYIVRIPVSPTKADSPLVVDAYAVLTFPVAAELLETIRWWNTKVIECISRIQNQELPQRNALKGPELAGVPPLEDFFRLLAAESLDHGRMITRGDNSVKRYYACLTLYLDSPRKAPSITSRATSGAL